MKKPTRTKVPRAPRTRNAALQLATIQKRLDEMLQAQSRNAAAVGELKREIEELRRDFSITMESLADLPFVSGSLH